jgi:hypothetical protein
MQRSSLFCVAILSLVTAPAAFGATVFLDDFNKANTPLLGSTPNVGAAWSLVSSTTNPLAIVSNAVPMTNNGQDLLSLFLAPVPNQTANVIHTSLDINLSAANATGDYFAHLGDGSLTIFFQRLFARSSGNGYQLGLVDTSGTGSTVTYGTTVLNFNQTYDVDVNWLNVAGANNDTFAVTVDSLPYLVHAWTSASLEPTFLNSAHLRQGTAANAATLTVDNYTVDALVVPEPASIVLTLICSVLGLVVRRNR